MYRAKLTKHNTVTTSWPSQAHFPLGQPWGRNGVPYFLSKQKIGQTTAALRYNSTAAKAYSVTERSEGGLRGAARPDTLRATNSEVAAKQTPNTTAQAIVAAWSENSPLVAKMAQPRKTCTTLTSSDGSAM